MTNANSNKSDLEYGFSIPMRGPLGNGEAIAALATRGEQLGYSYLAVPDHVVIPTGIESRYPYSQTGEFPGGRSGETLEQLASMAYLAAITNKARLLTSVMVVPHRGAVLAAKMLATIDVLSQGRLIVGCGAGWMQEEFDAISIPPFAERGRVTDEYLQVFKELWTQDKPEFNGEYAKFSGISFLPKPVQKPHPPIWIGGESGPAIRRAARYADAWFPIGANPRHPLNTVGRITAGLDRLHIEAEKIDRDPASIAFAFWANWYREGLNVTLDDGKRHIFTGNDEQIIEDINALYDLGARQLLFNFQRATIAESLECMERFTTEVLARV